MGAIHDEALHVPKVAGVFARETRHALRTVEGARPRFEVSLSRTVRVVLRFTADATPTANKPI
jgi:hypothetical protein